MISFALDGKTALVTGATGGIGGSVAMALAERGARVVLSGTREEVLTQRAKEIDRGAIAMACDLSDSETVDALVPRVEEAVGPLDILVNNAGLTRDNLAMRMKDDEWESVIKINLEAGFRLIRAAAKSMMRRRTGRIISITSVVGATGNAGQSNYAASKAGLIGLSKSVALELATRGVTVNCIAPGMIATAMTDALNDKQREAIIDRIPASRLGEPDEIAAAVVYLASDPAAYVTGQTLHVNGGLAMV